VGKKHFEKPFETTPLNRLVARPHRLGAVTWIWHQWRDSLTSSASWGSQQKPSNGFVWKWDNYVILYGIPPNGYTHIYIYIHRVIDDKPLDLGVHHFQTDPNFVRGNLTCFVSGDCAVEMDLSKQTLNPRPANQLMLVEQSLRFPPRNMVRFVTVGLRWPWTIFW